MTSARRSAISLVGQSVGARRHRSDQQLHVRAQRRQWRPQLVAGVGDQPRLAVARLVERPQHHVERLGEPCQLIVAVDRNRPQIVGARHPFRGLGQAGDGSQPVRATVPPAIAATAMPSPPTINRMVPNRFNTLPVGARLFEISSELPLDRWTASTRW